MFLPQNVKKFFNKEDIISNFEYKYIEPEVRTLNANKILIYETTCHEYLLFNCSIL